MSRQFTMSPAKRVSVPLLIALYGPSGGGKTYSALRLATGIGGKICIIDTESKRALHYADDFTFDHLPLTAPFGSLDYLAAIRYAIAQGATTVIVDSMSHEHDGEGGMVDAHSARVAKLSGGDWRKAERVKMLAWVEPKRDRNRLLQGVLQLEGVTLIFCFRAKEKLKLRKGQEPEPLGWMPIGGPEFIYEMTASVLLLPGADGRPTWKPEQPGERAMVKRPGWARQMFSDQLDEATGAKLAAWARGDHLQAERAQNTPPPERPTIDISEFLLGFENVQTEKGLAGIDDAVRPIFGKLDRGQQDAINAARARAEANINAS